MTEKTYPIELTKNQMKKLKRLIKCVREGTSLDEEFYVELSDIDLKICDIIDYGCFTHRTFATIFYYKNGLHKHEVVCKKCNLKRYKELKSKCSKQGELYVFTIY